MHETKRMAAKSQKNREEILDSKKQTTMDSFYGFTSTIADHMMKRYEEMGDNSTSNAMGMTTTDIVESHKMQEDTSLRNSFQMKVRIIDSYSDSKSMSQIRKDKIKRRRGSRHVLGSHL